MIFNLFKSRRSPRRSLGHARELHENGQLEEAIQELEALFQDNPENTAVLEEMAQVYAELEQDAKAIATLCRLLETDSREIRFIHFCTSFDSIRNEPAFQNVYQDLVKQLTKELEEDPGDDGLLFRLAEAHELLDAPPEAHVIYNQLADDEEQEDGTRAQAFFAASRLYAATGEADPAAQSLKSAVELAPQYADTFAQDPTFDSVRDSKAFADIQSFALDQQVKILQQVIQTDLQNPYAYHELIRLLFVHQRTDDSKKWIEQALQQFPDDVAFREYHGNWLFAAEANEEALAVYEDIILLVGRNVWLTYRVGVLYERLGNPSAASACFWEALGICDEEGWQIAFHIAESFARMGEDAGVLNALEKSVELVLDEEDQSVQRLLLSIEEATAFESLRESAEYQELIEPLRAQ